MLALRKKVQVASNRVARRNYEILEDYEAGIELLGTEVKSCRQGKAFWDDTFDERVDPLGKKYYWLTGSFITHEQAENSDVQLLKNNYVTVVPTQFDMTAYNSIKDIENWKLEL